MGSEDDQRERKSRHRPKLPVARAPLGAAIRSHAAESVRTREPDLASGRHHRHCDGRMVGLLHAGPQRGGPQHFAFAGHLGRRLALLRSARESHAHALALGETQHGTHGAGDFSLRPQRRFFQAQPATRLAMESPSRRYQVVADGAPGLSAFALAARGGVLVGAQFADATRGRAGIDGDHRTR